MPQGIFRLYPVYLSLEHLSSTQIAVKISSLSVKKSEAETFYPQLKKKISSFDIYNIFILINGKYKVTDKLSKTIISG